jgi:hypothetical protein
MLNLRLSSLDLIKKSCYGLFWSIILSLLIRTYPQHISNYSLTICTTGPFLPLASSHTACANNYQTSPLSRYLAVHYLMPQRVLSHIPSYSVGYSHAYITHPGWLIQSHTPWHILHVLTHTLLRTVISLPYDSLHYWAIAYASPRLTAHSLTR